MVTRTRTILVDDLDDLEITDGGGQTIEFSVGSTAYEIDLSNDNLGKLYDALQPFTEKARRIRGGARGRTQPESSSSASSGRVDKEQLQAIRQWAQENGYKVSGRGRISKEVQEAYYASQ